LEVEEDDGPRHTSLEVKEVLDALTASSVADWNAMRCFDALERLKGCEMHTTHLMDTGEERPLIQLGLNVTTDAKLTIPKRASEDPRPSSEGFICPRGLIRCVISRSNH
jgi:uncharacterized protein (UPF0371 family)